MYNGNIFTVINPSAVEWLPGIPIVDPDDNLDLRDLRRALWAANRAPEMAYMLRSTHNDGRFFSRLNFDHRALPIVKEGSAWVIDKEVQEKWSRLENSLFYTSDILLQATRNLPEAKFPLDPHWPLPHAMGYLHTHTQHSATVHALWKLRDALSLLAARCSLAIALTKLLPIDLVNYNGPPVWQQILMKAGATFTWIDELSQSLIADLSPGLRVGAFINPLPGEAHTQWLQHIPCIIQANLPVYIYWPIPGDGDYNKVWDIITEHCPSVRPYRPHSIDVPEVPMSTVVRVDRDHHGRMCIANPQNSFRWEDISSSSTPAVVEAPAAPNMKVPHGPGQRPGESFEDFRSCRAAQAEAWEKSETPEKKARRLAREAHAAQYNRPTRRSHTVVYLWTTIGEFEPMAHWSLQSLPYRLLVGHSKTLELWSQYPNEAKHYDSWRNEWDLHGEITENDDDTEKEDVPWETIVEENPLPDHLIQYHYLNVADLSSTPLDSIASELSALHQQEPHYPSFDLHFEDSGAVFYYRYSVGGVNLSPEQLVTGSIWLMHPPSLIRKHFGLALSTLADDVDDFPMYAMSAFIAVVLDKGKSNDHFGSLWDLDARSGLYLGLPSSRHDLLQITRWDMNDPVCYAIRYVGEAPCWFEVLIDSTTVLELCCQRSISSHTSAIAHLSKKGIRFRTVYDPHPKVIHPRAIASSPMDGCLGWRPPTFRATQWDYVVYEERAYEILASP
ncbi:hypothetical protein OBBRIDRAFT_839545 [Obba rivulosa]|uniref:Uncharacterized protein n=1 Tax=Obba rivulosa TaxID=1052685 RepID=A0A8E2DGA9_9APHY|nr:hypothetical protein OBBRIDRAFT_839545 [Obba rivulosa]